ncbi:hypothetical protein BN988_01538 [Oceanobacillus picturae]|uniref:Uncharacterized protein n=2 Tax=Oceanobacillus picturae TaxID=171693 RepID=W9ABC1_9BACI|nr:hypothetical protein BN988_01538 [Oceanobacillus picturae]
MKKPRYILWFLIVFIVIATVATIVGVMNHKKTVEKELSVEEFFSQEKLAFRESLGVENTNAFPQVQEAQSIVESTEKNVNADELKNTKKEIEQLLLTPAMLVETFNKNEKFDLQAYEDLQADRTDFLQSFNMYLLEAIENALQEDFTQQSEKTFEQMQKGETTGDEALDNLMKALETHGYRMGDYGVDQDPQWLFEHIENWEGIQGDKAYLQFLTDKETATGAAYEEMTLLSMEEISVTLLKLEEIYNTYKDDDLSSWATLRLSWHATELLGLYIRSNTDLEERKSELEGFLANHQDSIYWSIIDKAVQDYRSNDWQHTDYSFSNKLIIMFDDTFSGVREDDITNANRWPFDKQTVDHFGSLTEKKVDDFLNDLSPKQVVSLYMYSIEEGQIDDTMTLFDASIIEDGTASLRQEMLRQSAAHFWMDLAYETEYVVEKKNKKEATVFFLKNDVETPNEIAMQFILRKTNEGWKLLDIKAK